MRILAVTLDYPPDPLFGSGVVNYDLYAALSQAGHEVTALTPGRGRGGLVRDASGVSVWETPDHLTRAYLIPADRPGESFGDFADIHTWNHKVAQWLRHTHHPTAAPHVIHNHGWVTQGVADQLAAQYEVPVVTTAHVIDRHYQALPGRWPRASDPRYQAAEAASFARSTRIVVPSRTAHDVAARYYPEYRHKLDIVEHGLAPLAVNATPRPPIDSDIRVVFVGRLGAERGWDTFLPAFCTATDAHSELRLRVVGHGPGLDAGRDRFRHPAVMFLGKLPRTAVLREVAAADIFCNPALVETFGVAELEAMTLARCVVSGTGFGKHTLVEHLSSGVTIPIRHGPPGLHLDPRAWTGWLLRLADDAALRHRLGHEARTTVGHRYCAERTASTLARVLQLACGG